MALKKILNLPGNFWVEGGKVDRYTHGTLKRRKRNLLHTTDKVSPNTCARLAKKKTNLIYFEQLFSFFSLRVSEAGTTCGVWCNRAMIFFDRQLNNFLKINSAEMWPFAHSNIVKARSDESFLKKQITADVHKSA